MTVGVVMRYRSVLFDFDYTLVDSSPGIVKCINHALTQMRLPAVGVEQACRTIGLSLPDTFVALAGPELAPRAEEFTRLFVEHADLVMNDMTRLLPGAREAVTQLTGCGLSLGIVSTKYRYRIERFTGEQGIASAFQVMLGLEDVPAAKPDPRGLLLALERLGTAVSQALYVGDSVVDAQAAGRAGLTFVGVLSGKTTAAELSRHSPAAVLASVGELPAFLGCV